MSSVGLGLSCEYVGNPGDLHSIFPLDILNRSAYCSLKFPLLQRSEPVAERNPLSEYKGFDGCLKEENATTMFHLVSIAESSLSFSSTVFLMERISPRLM